MVVLTSGDFLCRVAVALGNSTPTSRTELQPTWLVQFNQALLQGDEAGRSAPIQFFFPTVKTNEPNDVATCKPQLPTPPTHQHWLQACDDQVSALKSHLHFLTVAYTDIGKLAERQALYLHGASLDDGMLSEIYETI